MPNPTISETEAPLPPMERQPRLGKIADLIAKIENLCDLACDDCYMYEWPDKSFRGRPTRMSLNTFDRSAEQFGEYATEHALSDVFVILHGGEPTKRKPEFIDKVGQSVAANIPPSTTAHLSIQTHAGRLTTEYLDVFKDHSIHVGVSLDGGEGATARHRLKQNGESSHKQTMAGIALLNKEGYRHLLKSLLAVIDLNNDPKQTYRELVAALQYGAKGEIDVAGRELHFLAPLGNWTHPVPGSRHNPNATSEAPLADWLIQVYNAWTDDMIQHRPVPHIRIFEEIMGRHVTHGRAATQEMFGVPGRYPGNVVIETDGSVHLLDALKTTGPDITALGLNVFDSEFSFTEAEVRMQELARRLGIVALPEACLPCPVQKICGGGWYPQRFNESTDPPFGNLPIYHNDWLKLIQYIQKS